MTLVPLRETRNMHQTKINSQINFIQEQIKYYKEQSYSIFISSSFQTHSIPLLHIISQIDHAIPVYFIDTGFHFPETYQFKEQIANLLDIQVISVSSPINKLNQRDKQGRFYFCSNSDYCCHINKILPLEPVLNEFDIWITGVRRDQNSNRKDMDYEAKGPFNTTRFHPMLDWNTKMIWEYRKIHNLPEHPLEKEGYLSVGCEPCTQKYGQDSRGGRWKGQSKNECGLHTELIQK